MAATLAQSKRPTKVQRAKMNLFLQSYVLCGSISDATQAVVVRGVPMERSTPARWAREFPEFADKMAVAREEVNDQIEKEIYRRAVDGWDEPVYQGGAQVGTIHKYDSTLLIFMAKANMPEKYRDKYEGANIGPTFNFAGNDVVRAIAALQPDELERLAARGKPLEGEVQLLEGPDDIEKG